MAQRFDHGGVLRVRDAGEQRVTPLELFFDLVYVFAITQLSHLLLNHPTIGGALQTLFLLLVVWWAWQYTTWFTNWFDPDALSVRLMLGALMLASLVMSVAIPEAFGERGLMFALAYVAIQLGRTLFAVLALEASHPLSGGFRRILAWFAASGLLWVAGGLAEGEARYVLWLLALGVDYAGPAAGYRTPGLGRSRTEEWNIEGAHFAERCQLFVIIALGESILVTGTTFGEAEVSAAAVAAFGVAFLGSGALWWIYFARSALAAADELTVAHPGDPGTFASISLTLGGTALFVVGHGVFLWAVSGRVPWSRLVAVVALAALAPVGFAASALSLAGAATLIVVLVAISDSVTHRRRWRPSRKTPT
jgi:low temperature requirement protein LtrA